MSSVKNKSSKKRGKQTKENKNKGDNTLGLKFDSIVKDLNNIISRNKNIALKDFSDIDRDSYIKKLIEMRNIYKSNKEFSYPIVILKIFNSYDSTIFSPAGVKKTAKGKTAYKNLDTRLKKLINAENPSNAGQLYLDS